MVCKLFDLNCTCCAFCSAVSGLDRTKCFHLLVHFSQWAWQGGVFIIVIPVESFPADTLLAYGDASIWGLPFGAQGGMSRSDMRKRRGGQAIFLSGCWQCMKAMNTQENSERGALALAHPAEDTRVRRWIIEGITNGCCVCASLLRTRLKASQFPFFSLTLEATSTVLCTYTIVISLDLRKSIAVVSHPLSVQVSPWKPR